MSQELYEQTRAQTTNLRYHKFGNKAGKLLSFLIKGPYTPTPIRSLRHKSGKLSTDPQEINDIFRDYYLTLYTRDSLKDSAATDFLNKLNLPCITQSQLESLNNPISEAEVTRIIRKLQNGKSPGPDGLTPKFFKML